MKQLCPGWMDKEAIGWSKERYTNDTAILIEAEGDTIIGLCTMFTRFDYVEGCKYSPVDFLEGIIADEEYRLKDIAKNLCTKNVRNVWK